MPRPILAASLACALLVGAAPARAEPLAAWLEAQPRPASATERYAALVEPPDDAPRARQEDAPGLATLRASETAAKHALDELLEERARAYERAYDAAVPGWRRLTGIMDRTAERRAHDAASIAVNLRYAARVGAARREYEERRRAADHAAKQSHEKLVESALPKGAELDWLKTPEEEREQLLPLLSRDALAALRSRLSTLQVGAADREALSRARERLSKTQIPPPLWSLRGDALSRDLTATLTRPDLAALWADFERAEAERKDQRALQKDWDALRAADAALGRRVDDELAAQRSRALAALGPESRRQFEEDFELVVVLERKAGGLSWAGRFTPRKRLRDLQLQQALAASVEWVTHALEVGRYERVACPAPPRSPDEALHRYGLLGRRAPSELVRRRDAAGALVGTGEEAYLVPWGWLRHGLTRPTEPRS